MIKIKTIHFLKTEFKKNKHALRCKTSGRLGFMAFFFSHFDVAAKNLFSISYIIYFLLCSVAKSRLFAYSLFKRKANIHKYLYSLYNCTLGSRGTAAVCDCTPFPVYLETRACKRTHCTPRRVLLS